MKKRIVSLLLCGIMVFSLAGCGGSGGSGGGGKDDVTLTMWTHQNEPWYDAYTRAIEGFEAEHEGVHIEIETFIHGALCISYSGQCFFSSMVGGRSRKSWKMRTTLQTSL